MNYLNLTIIETATGIEKNASIPKKIVENYISNIAPLLGQDPKSFNVSKDDVTRDDFEVFLMALVRSSSKNIGIYIKEIGNTFASKKRHPLSNIHVFRQETAQIFEMN